MFEISEHSVNMYLDRIDESVKFEIPMLRDLNMQTALDICLDVEKEDTGSPEMCPQTRKLFCSPKKFIDELRGKKKDKADETVVASNTMLAGLILENIKSYGMMNSSQAILDALIEGVRSGLPAAKDYLDSRIFRTEHPLLATSHHPLDSKFLRTCPAMSGDYAVVLAPTWGKVSDITNMVFKKRGAKQATRFYNIDLPEVHQ